MELNRETARVGDGATVCLYTDRHAYTIVKVTPSSLVLQRDKVTLAADWKPESIPGGFFAHTTNNGSQRWTYAADPDGQRIRVRWRPSRGRFATSGGSRVIAGRSEFYDYNF